MTVWQGIVYGIVQGLTEFLPVSSSGHLLLLSKIFEMDTGFVLFAVLLHIATLLAVIVALWKEVKYVIMHPFSKLTIGLIVATIPTVIMVLLFKSYIDKFFEGSSLPVWFCLTGVILVVTHMISSKKTAKAAGGYGAPPLQMSVVSQSGKNKNKISGSSYSENIPCGSKVKYSSAVIMGIAQGFATIPGLSRSGTTICAGLIAGESKENSAKFSFLMSIPIIIASLAYELIFSEGAAVFTEAMILPTVFAFIFSFIVGIFAVKFMLKLVQKGKLWHFSIYLFILSLIILLFY